MELETTLPESTTQLIRCQLDSGYTCNTISYKEFCKLNPEKGALIDPNIKLKLYDGTVMKPRGQSEIQC